MVVGFRDDWLREFFVEDVRSKKIPSDLESRLFRKIQMIDDAMTDVDLRVPPGNHFEKLRGNLEGFHSIRVNRQWRLIFHLWVGRISQQQHSAVRSPGDRDVFAVEILTSRPHTAVTSKGPGFRLAPFSLWAGGAADRAPSKSRA